MILTDKQARALRPGDKPVIDSKVTGLRLIPGKSGNKSKWILRFTSPVTGKRRDAGLGTYPEVSLAVARDKAMLMRRQISDGKDPIDERNRAMNDARIAAAVMNFEQAARLVHAELRKGWTNPKYAGQWLASLEQYVFPIIGTKKLNELKPADFADTLGPIWQKIPSTARRIRQCMHAVMEWAWAKEYAASNPVTAVDSLLSAHSREPEHYPAMPWKAIPEFVRDHIAGFEDGDNARAALLLLILTAARSGEVRGATWEEFDIDAAVWTIPGKRMKMKNTHEVPLPSAAVDLIRRIWEQAQHESLVFPSPRRFQVLSDMALSNLLHEAGAESGTPGRVATVHGFRSSFRDWAGEHGYARDLAERALAHAVSSKVEAAYNRTKLLKQRRPMMDAWAEHVCSEL